MPRKANSRIRRGHKLSPKIPLPEHWQSRRRSQSPPPSDPVPIRVHPCPSVASLQLVLRRKRNSHEEGAEFWPRMHTDGHGFQVSSQFLDSTLVGGLIVAASGFQPALAAAGK